MSRFSQVIAWIGTAYGAVASVYLWMWYFSAISTAGRSPFSLLRWPGALKAVLATHFVLGFFAVARLPKYWLPTGPANLKFRTIMISLFSMAVGALVIVLPGFVRFRGHSYFEEVLSGVFLIQTTYILVHFSTGTTLFAEKREQKEKLRVLLEAAHSHDVEGTCKRNHLPEKVYRRWRSEFGEGVFGQALSKIESQVKPGRT